MTQGEMQSGNVIGIDGSKSASYVIRVSAIGNVAGNEDNQTLEMLQVSADSDPLTRSDDSDESVTFNPVVNISKHNPD
jgi:hypothetical protein